MRFLSGGGTITNNVDFGPDGYIGYFIRTTTPGLITAPGVDDAGGLELGAFKTIIADGAWHLYQFNLDDDTQWDFFAGTANGAIDSTTTVSLDSIFVQGATSGTVDLYLDTVAYNKTGDLTSVIPEPGSIGLLSLGALSVLMRRRR
jgi:hypothetical protein